MVTSSEGAVLRTTPYSLEPPFSTTKRLETESSMSPKSKKGKQEKPRTRRFRQKKKWEKK